MKKILYIVPCYNEAGGLKQLLDKIRDHKNKNSDILVVDDASSDNTSDIAEKEGVKSVRHAINMGGGAAVRTGFKYAVRHGYDYTLQIDGDGQHDPKYAEKVLDPVINGEADMCIGSRFIEDPGYKVPFIRKLGIITYSKIVTWLSGQNITDCTSGYRAIHRGLFKKFADNYPDTFCTIESAIWAGRRGYIIEEVPVEMSEREEGQSYLTPIRMAKYPFQMIYAILRAL
ncbi:MAG: glycosyltransferase family 2 protein [Candidatus Nanohaloarchaea archaeon]|nr:glycosyltransferase family 2 protein [Candidatus Nanohaloarchaea archaeon]